MPTAVITGTNRGLGLEFTRRYLERNWEVIAITRHRSEDLDALTDDPALMVLEGELTDPGDLKRLVEEIGERSIDLLVNNAGIMGTDTHRLDGKQKQGLFDFSREEWQKVFEINVFTPAHLISGLKARFPERAKLVTVSSAMGSISGNDHGGWYAYRASKAAVNSLMKSVALELGEDVIAIALHPGWVRTDMGGPDADIAPEASIAGMMDVIDNLSAEDNGAYLGFDGSRLDY